jgi:hypothetical protein
MNANGKMIDSLTHSEMFQNYERAYTEATGLPMTLRPVETWQLPLHGKRKENRFCALMAERSRTCAACLQMQEKLAQSAMHQPATMSCAYGLYETAVLVKSVRRPSAFCKPARCCGRSRRPPRSFARLQTLENSAWT